MAEKNRAFHPLHTWRIPVDPEQSEQFWMVGIFETVDELNRWVLRYPKYARQFRGVTLGACCAVFRLKEDRKQLFLGYVLFAGSHLTPGIVAHEMVHAASYYLSEKERSYRYHFGADREEKLASLVQELCDRFWKKWWRYGEPKAKRWRRKKRRPRGPCVFTTIT